MSAADGTLDIATGLRPEGLVSLGIGGPEHGVPCVQFAPRFDAATAAGLHSVLHAGESAGPESIWEELKHLHAERTVRVSFLGHAGKRGRSTRSTRVQTSAAS